MAVLTWREGPGGSPVLVADTGQGVGDGGMQLAAGGSDGPTSRSGVWCAPPALVVVPEAARLEARAAVDPAGCVAQLWDNDPAARSFDPR